MPESLLTARVAERYLRQGWDVIIEPPADMIPFDLGSYKPDILAKKPGQFLVIEVRERSARLSPEKVITASDEVARHPGWKFVLVTGDDVDGDDSLISWADIGERLDAIKPGDTKAARQGMFLLLWSSVEALLRRRIVDLNGPLVRSPIKLLVKSLIDNGEITPQQAKFLSDFMKLRSELTHGLTNRTITDEDFQALSDLAKSLFLKWTR